MESQREQLLIVGCGIAGLTLALAARRHGINARLLERASALEAVGAGIQLSPNATRLLLRLGLGDALSRVAVRPELFEMRRWEDGRVLVRHELGDAAASAFGAPYLTIHRRDLQRVLLDALPPRSITLGAECVGVEGDEVVLADGARIGATAVIGADGIHSQVRRALSPDAAVTSGQIAVRAIVPRSDLPRLAGPPAIRMWLGPEMHAVSYSVSGGSEQSVSLSPPLATVGDAEEWTARCDLAPVRATLERWDPMLRDILDAAPFALRTALHDRELAGTIGRGRVTLVGDAAHPMLPFFAQGAAQAIEDACVLAACLADGASPRGEVPLRRYERLRAARVAEVHSRSRANEAVFHLPDGPGQAARDSGLAALSLGAFQWLYGYDAEAALGDG